MKAKRCKYNKVYNEYLGERVRCANWTTKENQICHIHDKGYMTMPNRVKKLENQMENLMSNLLPGHGILPGEHD